MLMTSSSEEEGPAGGGGGNSYIQSTVLATIEAREDDICRAGV